MYKFVLKINNFQRKFSKPENQMLLSEMCMKEKNLYSFAELNHKNVFFFSQYTTKIKTNSLIYINVWKIANIMHITGFFIEKQIIDI